VDGGAPLPRGPHGPAAGGPPGTSATHDAGRLVALAKERLRLAAKLLGAMIKPKRVEDVLRASEERYRSLFEKMLDGCAHCRMLFEDGKAVDLVHLEVNPAFGTLMGSKDVAGRTISDVIPGIRESNPELLEMYGRVASTGKPERLESYVLPLNAWLDVSAYSSESGHLIAVIANVTDRKLAEAERDRLLVQVRKDQKQLEALSHRLVVFQEEERRAIARELHDQIGQLLTGLKLLTESGGEKDEMLEVLSELISRVRGLSLDLRPPMLDTLGLIPTLLWHLGRYTAQTGVRVSFRERGERRRYSSDTEIAAFRIVQEALTNVARHAGAREVSVQVEDEVLTLRLRVEDDGMGFDPAAVPETDSIGLTGMKERARLLAGTLSIVSRPGRGTRVEAELPATDREPAA
jgi:signal transduction histidine kinase